ncbi:hypothetical protein CO172_00190 [Candidatus Uhrbacteria bacterium CG_4_9_14_3_um_filter_36_7]|uniref:M23ase beta-sheet core domain-containing protein n=1 Tax=Candidatus Uhrbacteria bacterium CG_4_9_14_3_um_filter_36_7 TaxID=1975033 RepID=A0A2M7XIH2_9BACT|nr:MAG: hypothetical protein CO172_00190 [Candidatus Uhrbacteria bacterium CG_4_9_14_3_um_filter_36_7]
MQSNYFKFFIFVFIIMFSFINMNIFSIVQAQTTSSSELNALKDEIGEKEAYIDQIHRKMNEYEQKIREIEDQQLSLKNETSLLENRIAKTSLEIEEAKQEIKAIHATLRLMDYEIQQKEAQLKKDRKMLESILLELQKKDDLSWFERIWESDSFSKIFDELHQLKNINQELQQTLEDVKAAKEHLIIERQNKTIALESLEIIEDRLNKKILQLENERKSKDVLMTQSQASEEAFRELVSGLREEQQYIQNQIAYLQTRMEQKLAQLDEGGETSLFSWPFYPQKGISAYFHDPTYPFRHLFEHGGIDLPAPTGTPIGSAGPGYVAWTRKGSQYGNYVMIFHSNGVATLYAHLSKIMVEPDQFVSRGETIGLVGSTGLSTGPHLHFEVRQDGIPQNPLDYLLSL